MALVNPYPFLILRTGFRGSGGPSKALSLFFPSSGQDLGILVALLKSPLSFPILGAGFRDSGGPGKAPPFPSLGKDLGAPVALVKPPHPFLILRI